MTQDVVDKAIEVLSAPDKYSRTPTDEGRRIKRVDGGYQIINFEKYKDRGYSANPDAVRKRTYRERKGSIPPKEVIQERKRDRECPGHVRDMSQHVPPLPLSPSASNTENTEPAAVSKKPMTQKGLDFNPSGPQPWDSDKGYQELLKILPQDSKGFTQKHHIAYPLFRGATKEVGLSALLGSARQYREVALKGDLLRLKAVHYWLGDKTYLEFKAVPKTVFVPKENKNGTDDTVISIANRIRSKRAGFDRTGSEVQHADTITVPTAENVG